MSMCVIKCCDCGATGVGYCDFEPEVNVAVITRFPDEWEGRNLECDHSGQMEVPTIDDDEDF